MDLNELTITELRSEAKNLGIKNITRYRKVDLLVLCKEAEAKQALKKS